MWKWVKVPKAIALLAFLLPWMTVSCSGQPLLRASGWDLAVGSIRPIVNANGVGGAAQPHSAMNAWLVLALLLIAIGLVLACLRRSRQFSLAAVATSAASLVLIWLGTGRYSKSTILTEAARKNGGTADPLAANMIQVDWHFGFWLALASLAVAGAMAWLTYAGRDEEVARSIGGAFGKGGAPPEP